jgi:NADH-quinone oxidoreductase chain I
MGGIREYFGNIADALVTTVKGMAVTGRHFTSEPPITVQYPRDRLAVPPSYRGVHILEQQKCIDCKLCAKACPVDCIEIEAVHHGRILEWQKFTIDYKKCIFCEFCIPPCPKDCIHMTSEYEMASGDNDSMIEDLLTWTGLRANDRREIDATEAKKAGQPAPVPPEGVTIHPGGPAPGNAAPSGTVVTSTFAPGSAGAPGGLPRGPRKAREGAAPATPAATAPGAPPAPAPAAPAAPGGDLAARVAAIKAGLAAKGKGPA